LGGAGPQRLRKGKKPGSYLQKIDFDLEFMKKWGGPPFTLFPKEGGLLREEGLRDEVFFGCWDLRIG